MTLPPGCVLCQTNKQKVTLSTVCLQHDCCPIHVASQGKPDVVKLLIQAKCDVNVQDSVSVNPLSSSFVIMFCAKDTAHTTLV